MYIKPSNYLSIRHVRPGLVGSGGQIPPSWIREQVTELTVDSAASDGGKPTVGLSFRFDQTSEGEYVSLCFAPLTICVPGDIFALQARVQVERTENLAEGFAIIREWDTDSKFLRQSTRPLLLSPEPQTLFVASEVKDPDRLLQPLIAFRKEAGATQGGGKIVLSELAFFNVYRESTPISAK